MRIRQFDGVFSFRVRIKRYFNSSTVSTLCPITFGILIFFFFFGNGIAKLAISVMLPTF